MTIDYSPTTSSLFLSQFLCLAPSIFTILGVNFPTISTSAFLPKGLALIRIADGLNAKGEMTYINPWNWLYKKVLIHTPGAPENGSLLYALCVITFMWAICYWMDKKKIYVKV